jgi:hypothetical protein
MEYEHRFVIGHGKECCSKDASEQEKEYAIMVKGLIKKILVLSPVERFRGVFELNNKCMLPDFSL